VSNKQLDFRSPYGVFVKIIPDPHTGSDRPEDYVFPLESAAVMAGIYQADERARFCRMVQERGSFNPADVGDFGGHVVPRVPLPRPKKPISPQIEQEVGADIPLDAWVDELFRQDMWHRRIAWLEETIDGNLDEAKGWQVPSEILAIGLVNVMTAAFEHLPDQELDDLDQAAWFALTSHEEWQKAALKWLTPFKDTWFKDWVAARPRYRRFAAVSRKINDLPLWICGGQA